VEPATHPLAADLAGQRHRSLPAPAGHQGVEGVGVHRAERARRAPGRPRGLAQHAPPQRLRQRRQRRAVQRAVHLADPAAGLVRELVEGVRVGTQLPGGARQRRGNARSECRLQGGQRRAAHPGAGERRVGVGGVGHGVEAERRAGGAGRLARQVEQRAAEAVPAPRHAGQRPCARSPGEAEQDRLGLVVAGVPEQHHGRPRPSGGGVQRGEAGVPRGALRTA
jgi:hypothetical protein